MASGMRPGTLYVLKKDCTGKNKEKVSSKSKSGEEIHVLKGSLYEYGTDRSSNPKKITLHSCENNQIIVACNVNDVEEISPEEYQLLSGISACADRLKVLEDKNWLAEGLSVKVDNFVHVIKQKGIPDKTDAVVKYKGPLPGQNGIQFGVELLAYRGKGTTNGVFRQKRYFECEENCGLFIPLNKIRLNKRAIEQAHSPLRQNGVPQPLVVGDRIVWYSDSGPEHGVVKWIGVLPGSDPPNEIAGVEFDNPIGTGNGKYKDKQLFKAKYKHASLVPIYGLIREDDLYSNHFKTNSANGISHHGSSSSLTGLPGVEKALKKAQENVEKGNSKVLEEQKRRFQDQQVNGTRVQLGSTPSPTTKQTFGAFAHKNDMDSKVYHSDTTRYATANEKVVQNADVRHKYGQNSYDTGASAKLSGKDKLATGYSTVYSRSADYRPPPSDAAVSAVPKPVVSSAPSSIEDSEIEIGTMVEVQVHPKKYGVVKWIGFLPHAKNSRKICGLEMEDEQSSYNDGTFGDNRYFECPDQRGLFVYLSKVKPDPRFMENPKYIERTNSLAFGSMASPDILGDLPPLSEEDVRQLFGKRKGIQGHHNSCYLDSSLFTMFAFTDVFDSILYREPRDGDHAIYEEVQYVLKNSIVNSLRQNYFVRADKVVQLRTLLDKVGLVKGMMTEEKDPEEFLSLLLEKVMKADPLIRLSSGQESHFYQLFIEKDERLHLPTIQQLLELSFMQSDIKLSQIPACLILQMPRFGKDYKMYQRIVPSLTLDITDVLEYGVRECTICGQVADWECKQCYREWGDSLSKIAYCTQCNQKSHTHAKRADHKPTPLKVPKDFNMDKDSSQVLPREVMELFGVICIQTSHYVSFVKCGTGDNAQWVFFDSMADRMGEANGYNVPEVKPVPQLQEWLSDKNIEYLSTIRDAKEIDDPLLRRLLSDAYVCLYQSVEVSKYQA